MSPSAGRSPRSPWPSSPVSMRACRSFPSSASSNNSLARKPRPDMSTENIDQLLSKSYRHGFVTDIDSDTLPPGLDEDVVRFISRKKKEPAFLTEWRLKAYRHWLTMREPHWAKLRVNPIDYQAISYFSAPKP